MSVHAASLPCPICLHTGIFNTAKALKDRLIYVSTNNISCPVCQEPITGLDKLTIHLFSHIQSLSSEESSKNTEKIETKNEKTQRSQTPHATQKKIKTTSSKNKASSTTAPVKFVKICPKLPVIALNTVPFIDISQSPVDGSIQTNNNSVYVTNVKVETTLTKTETSCKVCGLNFVNSDILKMHKCLLHKHSNKSDTDNTRHSCHLCSKNFKMRGSLMVHLRVAHYGFSSILPADTATANIEKNDKGSSAEKSITLTKNDGKQWQCDVCRKSFTTKYFLKKHKRLHTG